MKLKRSMLTYDEYISKHAENVDKLNELLSNEFGINIFNAKPGSGKTTAIINVSKQLADKNKNNVYLIAAPFKSQVQQGAKNYKVGGYIKGVKFNKNERVVFCIYDRLSEITRQYKNEGYKVHIVIDECHQLHAAYSYRTRTIRQIKNLMSEYPILLVSATTRLNLMAHSLGLYNIDELVECVPTKERNTHKTIVLDVPSKDRMSMVADIIGTQAAKHDLTMVRVNNKTYIDLYKTQLESVGYNVGIVYTGLSEGEESVITDIVENETIDDKYDIILTTCKLDVAVNIKKNHTNICVIHAAMSGADCEIDAIEQFPDRFRNGLKTHIILTCSDYQVDYRIIDDLYKLEYKPCEDKLLFTKQHIELAKMYGLDNILNMKTLKNTDMNGESLADYGITLDKDDNLVLDEWKILNRASNKYSNILYRRPDMLERVLKEYGIAQDVEFQVYQPINLESTKETLKEVVKVNAETKAEKDKLLDQYIEVLSGATDLILGVVFEGLEENLPQQYQEAADFISEHYSKVLTGIYECLSVGYTHREIINVLVENAKKTRKTGKVAHSTVLSDMRLKMQHLTFNKAYKQGNLHEIVDGSHGREYKAIRDFMRGKGDRPYLTKELIEELTAYINKSKGKKDKKIDTKATGKTLISIYKTDERSRLTLRIRHSDLFI